MKRTSLLLTLILVCGYLTAQNSTCDLAIPIPEEKGVQTIDYVEGTTAYWYSYSAPADQDVVLQINADTEDYVPITGQSSCSSPVSYTGNAAIGAQLPVKKGETCYIRLTLLSALNSFRFNVEAVTFGGATCADALELKAGNNVIPANRATSLTYATWMKYKANQTGRLTIVCPGKPYLPPIYRYDDCDDTGGTLINSSGDSYKIRVEKDETFLLKFGNSSLLNATVSCTSVEQGDDCENSLIALTGDDNLCRATRTGDHWFGYEAGKEGFLEISSCNMNTEWKGSVLLYESCGSFPAASAGSCTEENGFLLRKEVTAGKSYLFNIRIPEGMPQDFNFSVNVTDYQPGDRCDNPIAATAGDNLLPSLMKSRSTWYSYTPENDGWINVSVCHQNWNAMSGELTIQNSCDSEALPVETGACPDGTGLHYKVAVKKGSPYILCLKNKRSFAGDVTFTIAEEPVVQEKAMQLDSVIQYNEYSLTHRPYLKSEYSYDLQGNAVLKIVYSYPVEDDGFWVYSRKEEITYDGLNRPDTRKRYTWNANAGVWISSTRQNDRYFYRNESMRIDSVYHYRWDGNGEWLDKYEKEIYTYSDNGREVSAIWYSDANYSDPDWPVDWKPSEKKVYEQDGNGRVLKLTNYYWNGYYPSGDWTPSDRDEYTYDDYGNVLTLTKFIALSGSWIGNGQQYKHEYQYDNRENIVSDKTYRMTGESWEQETYYTFDYFYSETSGNVKELPYTESFEEEKSMNEFTAWNASGDVQNSWSRDAASKDIQCEAETAPGDWLFTPALHLPATNRYQVSFKTRCEDAQAPGKLKVLACKAANPAQVIALLAEELEVGRTDEQTYTYTFLVPQEANYYIGFYVIPGNQSVIRVDDLAVQPEKSIEVPAKVDNLTGTPGQNGVKEVDLMFHIPNLNLAGMLINRVDGYVIERSGCTAPVYENKKGSIRGDLVRWKDTNVPEGTHVYSVYTYNEYGKSDVATVEVNTGVGYPDKVKNLRATETAPGICELTWEAPDHAPQGLTYTIYRLDATETELLASGTSEHTYTDRSLDVSAEQVAVQYGVAGVSAAGEGPRTLTADVVLGNSYEAPFLESFAGCGFTTTPWITIGVIGSHAWALTDKGVSPDVAPQDLDGGMALFSTLQFMPGNMARLASPKIDISSLEMPELKFWMAHSTMKGKDALVVKVSMDNGTFEKIDSIPVKAGSDGWVEHTLRLDTYKGCKNLRLGFVGVVGREQNIYLDHIQVADGGSSISSLTGSCAHIYGINRSIIIEGAAGKSVVISTIDGKVIYSSPVPPTDPVPVRDGVYLVRLGDEYTQKVIVR